MVPLLLKDVEYARATVLALPSDEREQPCTALGLLSCGNYPENQNRLRTVLDDFDR